MASKIDILIKAKDQASAEINKITGSLNGLSTEGGQSTENVGLGFDEMVGVITTGAAIAAAAVAALQKAIEFSREGAEIVRLQDTSASLASSMGFDMDEIVAKVSAASLHTVSDMDIMSSAAKAMMLGVGSSAGEMASLMEVAAIRGRALGLDATEAFDQIVRGIGRLSPKILDNLGIIVDADVTYAAYAESIGKSADELTEMEKRQALVDAVIADTAPLLAETGGLVEDSASKWKQLETAQANFFNSLKADAADMMGWWPDFWIKFYEAMTPPEEANADVINVMDALNEALLAGIIDLPTYNAILGDVNNGLMSVGEAMDIVAEKESALRDANVSLSTSQEDLIYSLIDSTSNFEQFRIAAEEAGVYIGIIDEELYNSEKALRSVGTATRNTTASLRDLEDAGTKGVKAIALEMASLEEQLANANLELAIQVRTFREDIGGQLYDMLRNAGLEGEDLESRIATLDTVLGTTFGKEYALELAIDDLFQQLLTDPEGFAEAFGSFEDAFFPLQESAQEAITKVMHLQAQLDALVGEYNATINITTNGSIPNIGGGGGGGGDVSIPGIWASGGVINAAAGVAAGLSHYWVGERGPEPFFPAIDGRIVSNTQAMAALRGGAGANAREIANAVRDGVREAMRDERVGNVYNLTMPTSSNPADVRTAFELMEAWGA